MDTEVKTRWTSGPWESAGLTIIESSGQRRDIGELFSCHEFTVEISETEALANALLISKAPEMADLLRDGKHLVERSVTHVTHGGPTISEALEWIRKADVLLSALEKIGGTK